MIGRAGEFFAQSELIRQSEAGECGLACLAMVARHHGDQAGMPSLRRRFPLSSRGSSLKDLISISDQLGFHSRALKSDIPSLLQVRLPAVLHWDLNHFVVLNRVRRGTHGWLFTILDPAGGIKTFQEAELSDHFTGIVLELTPSATFSPSRQRTQLRLSQLWTRLSGIGPALFRILILSVIMQIVTLITPFYMQLAVDTVLPGADLDLLTIIAIGFSGLLLLNAMTAWVRARLTLSLSNSLGLQTAVNLFRHTMFLPTSWFEKRHLGDVVSRFGSLQPINDLLSKGMVSSLVDGALALTTLCLMMIYSPLLTVLSVGILLIYASIKLTFFKSMKFANANVLTAQAVESSAFIENIRGISAIKVFCQEGNRQRLWQNKKAAVINGSVRLGRLTSAFDNANMFVVGLESIIFVYISIKMVIAGELTLGMVFAFQAYKQNFVGSITRLIDQAINYRLLDVHLDRISDIAFEPREQEESSIRQGKLQTIELQEVSFSYGFGLPLILKDVSFKIVPGQTTVIVGASGSGKTTLFKILCGLLEPTSGRILLNGVPVSDFGLRRYRSHLGVVSQDDTLFAGSLAENIAFFDADYDINWIVECCEKAAIHQDVVKMPMRYETMVGDMGSNLSGGQKQRVLLARALFRRPDVLLLDEATAHLDVSTETRVVAAIKSLGGTQILVAHRPETIRMADIVIRITDGQAVVEPLAMENGVRQLSPP